MSFSIKLSTYKKIKIEKIGDGYQMIKIPN